MSKHTKSKETQLEEIAAEDLRDFDRIVTEKYGIICGIDEAGRGPLAGDVYAAAVILDPERPIIGLNDSKKLTPKKREMLFDEIIDKAAAWCVGVATVAEIEETDILSADLLAMKRAYEGLLQKADIILVDGDVLPEIDGFARNVIKGDAKSEAVAAASILAKVSRDRYMKKQAELYPQYSFEKNAGYGSKAHFGAIDEFGICPIHRKSFLKKHFEKNNSDENR